MQPDEIIQKKTWAELTTAEKLILTGLADNEQEFDLIKKMLLVSAEEIDDVPAIAPRVQQNIRKEIKTPVRKMVFYKYAVAAVLLAAIAGIYFFNGDKTINEIKGISSKEFSLSTIYPKTVVHDTLKNDVAVVPAKTSVDKNDIDRTQKQSNFSKDVLVAPVQQVYASASYKISTQPDLLEIVTEIY